VVAKRSRAKSGEVKDPLLELCRSLPGVTEDVKWGNDLIFSVGGKMFAGFQLPDRAPLAFKVDPLVFSSLVSHDGIVPAPYMARHHWVSVATRSSLPLRTLKDLLSDAHALVAAKLPAATRRRLGLVRPDRETRPRRAGATFEEVRDLAFELPAVEEGLCYGTPALRVKGKFLLRLREDGETIAIKIPMDDREVLLQADPEVFYITDHYRGYPAILFRLSAIRRDQLADLLELAWRFVAPKRLLAAFDASRP
jgi:predicted DNA-binding protein (MmcQ/YjbR family)